MQGNNEYPTHNGIWHSVAAWGYDETTDPNNKYLVCCNTWTPNYNDSYIVYGDWMQATITWVQAKCTLTVSQGSGGSTSPGSGGHGYHYGDIVNITATPNTGYNFVRWNIDGSGTIQNMNSASTTVTLNGECTISALFIGSNPTVGMEMKPVDKLELLLSFFKSIIDRIRDFFH